MIKKLFGKFKKQSDVSCGNDIDTLKISNPDGTALAYITVEIPADSCGGSNTAKAWTAAINIMLREVNAQRQREIEMRNKFILDEWFEQVYGNEIPVQ